MPIFKRTAQLKEELNMLSEKDSRIKRKPIYQTIIIPDGYRLEEALTEGEEYVLLLKDFYPIKKRKSLIIICMTPFTAVLVNILEYHCYEFSEIKKKIKDDAEAISLKEDVQKHNPNIKSHDMTTLIRGFCIEILYSSNQK